MSYQLALIVCKSLSRQFKTAKVTLMWHKSFRIQRRYGEYTNKCYNINFHIKRFTENNYTLTSLLVCKKIVITYIY